MHLLYQNSYLTQQNHLAAEVLAIVVYRLFPNVSLIRGGINSVGFYYDFLLEQPLTNNMLELIEVHMHQFIKEAHPVRYISMMRENAQTFFNYHKHFLLAQQVGEQQLNILDFIHIQDFYGLCPPLSLTTTEEIGYIRLLNLSKLSEEIDNEKVSITRLQGIAQKTAKNLKVFIKNYDLFLKKKDHRFLGPKLNFFSFSENALGLIWHPKGVQLQIILRNWLKSQLLEEENLISTPSIICQGISKIDKQEIDPFSYGQIDYHLRSSLLSQHIDYLTQLSLKKEDLPYRINECTPILRPYSNSQRWGLFYQSTYLTNCTTIACSQEQLYSELISSLHFIEQIITILGFEAQWYLVISQLKNTKNHQKEINYLRQAIQSYGHFLEVQEDKETGLELRVKDVLGREWPISHLSVVCSIKLDQIENQFVVLNRRIWESIDCLIALLIEKHEGHFPLWLAPEQVRVLSIGEANHSYACQISQRLQCKGMRVKLDNRSTKLGIRVHEAEKECVPYLVLVGEQERIKQTISVRTAEKLNHSQSVDIGKFLDKIEQELLPPMLARKKTE